MPNEPSMEEILSSIKRIIAEEDGATQAPRAPRRAIPQVVEAVAPVAIAEVEETVDDQVLELTDALPGEPEAVAAPVQEEPVMTVPAKPDPKPAKAAPRPRVAAVPQPETSPETPSVVMSDISAQAARESLVSLSKLLVRPEDGQSNTLEGLVRDMLRPMLKEWLDAHLPEMVESMVKREIDRITGRV